MRHFYNDSTSTSKRRSLRKNQTDAERKLWSVLRNKQMAGLKFFRQYSVGFYILDFYCPQYRLAIEVDGGQHEERDFKKYDAQRAGYLKEKDIKTLRFWNNEVLKNIEGVWEKIKEYIEGPHNSSYPPLP